MKKTLALVLALALVSALCGMLFVSAEDVNLAAGKEVANAKINGSNANYCANLTDGVTADAISTDNGVWFAYYYNSDLDADKLAELANTDENGVALPTIDLGAAYELSSVRMHIVDQADWSILAPTSAIAQVSNDGETFTDVATVTEFAAGVTWVEFDLSGQTAQYVRLAIDLNSVWFFLDEIEVYGAAAEGGNDEPPVDDDPVEDVQTYEDYVVGEDGNAVAPTCYGYTWTVNYVDGTIAGEDVTIVTNLDAYAACNAKWAISAVLEKQADGTYVAVADAVAGTGENPTIELGENQIVLVVHSSSSKPADADTYANWLGKVAAAAIKAGDVFEINEEMTSVHAVVPGAEDDEPSKEPSKPVTPGGDAGILVFAVLGVVAVCGAAVTIKARG